MMPLSVAKLDKMGQSGRRSRDIEVLGNFATPYPHPFWCADKIGTYPWNSDSQTMTVELQSVAAA